MQNPLERKNFLIVDDFGDMRSMLRTMLSVFGVTQLDTASNGKDAIQLLERNKYDVILCDYNLGNGKNGQQILEEARYRKLISFSTVFVMVTAEHTQEMVLGAIEYEPDSYLSKPFSKDLLRNRLEKLLAKKHDLEPVDKALEENDYGKALHLLGERIASKPKNLAELTRWKAELCLRAGSYDDALEIYEKVLAIRAISWARLGLGKVLYARSQFTEAKEIFQDLIEENERLTGAYDWLAKAHLALGELDSAQEVLATAVELSPKAILKQKALGEVALKNKDFGIAEQAFAQAINLGKHSVHKHPALYAGLVESQTATGDGKNSQAAIGVIRQMEREFGKSRDAQVYAALSEATLQNRLGNDDEADRCLERAHQHFGRLGMQASPQLTLELAKTSARLDAGETAASLFRQVVKNNHDDDEFLREVESAYLESGLTDSPKQLIEEIRQEIIDLNNRGVELAATGQIREAVGLFEEAADGMSGNKIINLNAAKVLIMQLEERGLDRETLSKARKYIERTRKLDPEDIALAQVVRKYHRLVADA